jgi:hypothetical protein
MVRPLILISGCEPGDHRLPVPGQQVVKLANVVIVDGNRSRFDRTAQWTIRPPATVAALSLNVAVGCARMRLEGPRGGCSNRWQDLPRSSLS